MFFSILFINIYLYYIEINIEIHSNFQNNKVLLFLDPNIKKKKAASHATFSESRTLSEGVDGLVLIECIQGIHPMAITDSVLVMKSDFSDD